MAAAMIKDGETVSGPPPRSLRGGPAQRQIILPMTQTGPVVFFCFLFFLRVLFNYAHRFFADWRLLHVLEIWKSLFF